MGVAGYSEMARMLGLNDVADKYADIAKKMAVKWEEMANEGDHYRLAFARKNTYDSHHISYMVSTVHRIRDLQP